MNIYNLLTSQTILLFICLVFRSEQCIDGQNYCSTCISNSSCGTCEYGFGKYISGGDNLCEPCQPTNCQDCSVSSSCTSCSVGFRITSIGGFSVCQACNDNRCQVCDAGINMCSLCYYYNRLRSDNRCEPCQQNECMLCDVDRNICTKCCCRRGVNITTGRCVNCLDTNCSDCSTNFSKCDSCVAGMGILNEQCVPCSSSLCLQCPYNYLYCQRCQSGYGSNSGTCQTCLSENCVTCSQYNLHYCTACVINYGLSNNRCRLCEDVLCEKCFNNNTICVECKAGYGLTNGLAGNPCQLCRSPCSTCRGIDNTACTSCIVGYYLKASTDSCVPCSNIDVNCQECSDANTCTLCINNFYADSSGVCTLCPPLCTQCYNNLAYSSPECTACQPTYVIKMTNPPVCGEVCGDYIAEQTECDDPLGVQYDGCNDTCQVMDGFQCRKVNNKSTCSYENQIDMEIVDIVKKEFFNSFTLTMKVWPPLYVFKTSDLKGVFFINDPTFTIESVVFDPATNQIIFQVSYTADYLNKDILIEFIPDENVDVRYYASVNSNALKLVWLEYYPEWVLKSSLFSYYLFYVIMVLGNLAALIGLIGKRLAGIQAMFVYQFAYLSMVWLNYYLFLPFEVISPLKYTNGYHKQGLISSSSAVTKSEIGSITYSYPHTQQFGFDEGTFLNNFNIFFVFQVLSLLSYAITSIIQSRLRKKKYGYRKIYEENDQIVVKLRQHINRVTIARQYSATCLLYFGLINMIYFIACSYLFISAREFQAINISAFGVVVFIYVLTLLLFWFDPDPFDYFRYSFRRVKVALCSYYVYPLVIASSALLVVAIKQTWPCIIPVTLLLLYVLIYRPYGERLENYRSALNLIVIICWASLRIHLQLNPQKKNEAYVFNFLNTLLLFVVMVVSYISLVYYIIYKCYLEKKVNKTDEEVVMSELDAMNVRDKMELAKSQDMVFKKLLQPRINIMQFSNSLRPIRDDFVNQYSSVKKQVELQRIQKPNIPTIVEQKKKKIDTLKEKMQRKQVQLTKEEFHENSKLIYAMEVLDKQNKFIRLKNAKDFTLQLMREGDQVHQESYIDNYNKI